MDDAILGRFDDGRTSSSDSSHDSLLLCFDLDFFDFLCFEDSLSLVDFLCEDLLKGLGDFCLWPSECFDLCFDRERSPCRDGDFEPDLKAIKETAMNLTFCCNRLVSQLHWIRTDKEAARCLEI